MLNNSPQGRNVKNKAKSFRTLLSLIALLALVSRFISNFAIHNPISSSSLITYSLANPCVVSLKVYDSVGRLVTVLVNETQSVGIQSIRWDVSEVANGVYFLYLETDVPAEIQKVVVEK